MHHIALGQCHLPQDEQAIYQDIMVNDKPLQALLKQSYQVEFSQGRYRELFMPILLGKAHPFEQQSNIADTVINPIYGCQDDCCIYVYVSLTRSDNQVRWGGCAIDSYYMGAQRSEDHALIWLQNFTPMCFAVSDYDLIFKKPQRKSH